MKTKNKPSNTEKRKHPRTAVGIALEIYMKGLPVSRAKGTIIDLSDGGMSFMTDAVMEEGMSFFLRANMPLRIRGEVRSIREAGAGMRTYGIRFHKIGFTTGDETRPNAFVAASFNRKPRVG